MTLYFKKCITATGTFMKLINPGWHFMEVLFVKCTHVLFNKLNTARAASQEKEFTSLVTYFQCCVVVFSTKQCCKIGIGDQHLGYVAKWGSTWTAWVGVWVDSVWAKQKNGVIQETMFTRSQTIIISLQHHKQISSWSAPQHIGRNNKVTHTHLYKHVLCKREEHTIVYKNVNSRNNLSNHKKSSD